MPFIRRTWTPREADEWAKEDWITVIISPLCYILFTLGILWSILLQPIGFILLGSGIVLTYIMHWIIDPKLKSISEEYEKKQKAYLEDLEKHVRWEDKDG
jgi:amino acid transporter